MTDKQAALDALDWLIVSLDMSHTEWCDKASWRDTFKENVETIRQSLTETKSCGGGGVMEIDIRIAKEILDAFGGEDAKMTLVYCEDGHSGEGYYIYCSDYPEDGAIYLGMAED